MGFLAEPVLVRRTFGLFRVVTVIISRSFTFNGLISLEFSRNGSLLVRAFLSNLASLVSLYFAFSFSSFAVLLLERLSQGAEANQRVNENHPLASIF